MFSAPAITVHGLDHACAALQPGLPVVLLSARGAALYAGCAWWRAVITAARAKFPTTPTADLLDCADAPGRAMTALRLGQKAIVLDPACPAFTAVSAIAASRDAIVLPHRPPCLDMMNPTAQRQLAAWLQPDIGAG